MKKKIFIYSFFVATLVLFIVFLIISILRTNEYNKLSYEDTYSGSDLFTTEEKTGFGIRVQARNSTWGKIFDFDNEGITENNYEAHTYDFYIKNNTNDEVKEFSYKFILGTDAYLFQAWNGALEIHQVKDDIVETIPDLRDYNPDAYELKKVFVDGEALIHLQKDDYFVYIPNTVGNAMEMPIQSHLGTTPGMIIYVKNGESIENSTIVISYKLYRVYIDDILFKVAVYGLILWAILLVAYIISALQIRKYRLRHDRDNEIINESIETFTGFIDAKDPYTNGHSKRVAIYTRLLAEKLGFQGEELDRIYYIALLHDCGKIGVPDNILGKPGKLTDEEFEIIKSHTVRGGEILSRFKSLKDVDEGARYHHERYDGKGYPEGLKGEDIPLIARIICVADSFDAMNSSRIYRKRLSKEYIISELENNKGTQFDPKIADIMLNLIKDGKIKMDE